MSVTAEASIIKDIKEFLETYGTIMNQVDYNYTGLSRAREQFPLSFLNKKGIEIHINKLSNKNKDKILAANREITKSKKELADVNQKMKKVSADNIEELEKLSNLSKKLKDKMLKAQSETQLLRKLELDVTPEKFTYFYEDLLLFVATCKHEALELWKYACTVYEDIKLNEEHFSGKMLIDVADDALKDKGYTKIISDFRVAFLNSKTELKELRQLMSRAKVLRDASSKLLSAFEADEVNFRKFTERSNRLGGI